MRSNYEATILQLASSAVRLMQARPLVLGAITSSGGGLGQPPGGYVGYLPQTRVAGDLSELSASGLPASGITLLDNLNKIRYRLDGLESNPVSALSVLSSGVLVASGVSSINFNTNLTVSDLGSGVVSVNAPGGGGLSTGKYRQFTWASVVSGGWSFVSLDNEPVLHLEALE